MSSVWTPMTPRRQRPRWRPFDSAWQPVANHLPGQHEQESHGGGRGGGGAEGGKAVGGGAASRFKGKTVRADAQDTQQAYRQPDGNYTPERAALHRRIKDESMRGKTPVERPTAYLMGGGPAAGKSTIIGSLGLGENVVTVDPDHYKTQLPEYEAGRPDGAAFVHEESSDIGKSLTREASAGGYNLLVDGTGDGRIEVLEARVKAMKGAGQRVVAHYVTTDTETAVSRSEARARRTGRYVPESVIRAVHAGVSRTVPQAIERGLFDEFTLWDTSAGRKKIAEARGKELTVHDEEAWRRFLAKGNEPARTRTGG